MLLTQADGRHADRRPRRFAGLVALSRPLHAMKNLLLVPVALVDAPQWTSGQLVTIGWPILAFTLAGAAVYVGNDIADRDRDRHHPVKRHRPIAAGGISVRAGILYCTTLLALLATLVALAPGGPYWPVLVYLALNIAYSRGLKHVPLVDIGIVALGFVLRVVQGYVTLGTPVSAWLVVAVFSMCLFLLNGKRRHELITAGLAHRPALHGYSVELIDQLLPLCGMLSVVAGLTYLATEAPLGDYQQLAVLLSAPVALFVLFRYLQVLVLHRDGGDPVRILLRDKAMAVAGALWLGMLAVILAVVHS
jgi:decaprenyl-phosphate phosphoribosyltransferase